MNSRTITCLKIGNDAYFILMLYYCLLQRIQRLLLVPSNTHHILLRNLVSLFQEMLVIRQVLNLYGQMKCKYYLGDGSATFDCFIIDESL